MADTPTKKSPAFRSVSMQSETYDRLLAFKARLEAKLEMGRKVPLGKVVDYLLHMAPEKDEDLPQAGPC